VLPKILKPFHINKSNLIRIGPKRDGGYVIDKRVLSKTKAIVTLGLNDDWSFEKEFIKKNRACKVYAYDHTVNNKYWIKRFKQDLVSFIKLKKLTPFKILDIFKYLDYLFFFSEKNTHFIKKIVANKKNSEEETIDRILGNLDNVILKVDIENDEYKVLGDIIKNNSKINLLIIEFHQVNKNFNKIKKFILNNNLKIIHLHANNFGGLDKKGMPTTLEATFLNQNKFKTENRRSKKEYPIKGLDYKNHRSKEEIKLKFYDRN
tara:strand:+ start:31 stop:816 length:786 start_codon:yes stop_codon:yes gene_type:complete